MNSNHPIQVQHTHQMSSLALSFCFCEEQIQHRRSKRRHLEFVLPLSKFYAQALITQVAHGNRHRQLLPAIRAKVVSSTRIPVSQRNWMSRNENKISQPVSRNENKVFHSLSRNENIDVRFVWSQNGGSCVTAVSRVPDHHSLLPAICETCTWLPRSYSCLFCVWQCESGADRPVHERFHESSRVAHPIQPESHDSCSTHQTQSWYLSLVSSTVVGSDLLHRANAQQIECSLQFCSGGRFRRSVTESDTEASREHSEQTRS